MDNSPFTAYKIEERSYLSIVKRDIRRKIAEAGFSSQKAGEIDIIVSELTSNLMKHTSSGGEVIFRIVSLPGGCNKYFEIFCIDHGHGASDIQKMVKDGFSSSNTLGQGLGAINRLSDFFQIYSMKDWGTIVYSLKCLKPENEYKKREEFEVKVIQESIPGEVVCGDGYHIKKSKDETRIFVGDGLGHGVHAHAAVTAAIEAFEECDEGMTVDVLRYIHSKVKKTRGLVATIAILDHKAKIWRIAGVGNINTRLYHGLEYKTYMPHNGIIGLNIPTTMNDYQTPAERFQTIVMTSDGIRSKWDLTKYISILKYDPAILAAAVYKDHARRTDDMTVLVGKII